MAETYYAYMVQFGDQQAIVMTMNPTNNGLAPMLFSEREFMQRKEELEKAVKEMVNSSNKEFMLMKFSKVEMVDWVTPDNMLSH